MTLENFIEQTKDMPRNAIILAYDPEDGEILPITGIIYGPNDKGVHTIEVCTDDNS